MPRRCARCRATHADRLVYPSREWVDYLETDRGLASPDGPLAVPLCRRCHSTVNHLRQRFRERELLFPREERVLQRRIEEVLDELDLDALVDEAERQPDYLDDLYR